jgi:hypothetical protein
MDGIFGINSGYELERGDKSDMYLYWRCDSPSRSQQEFPRFERVFGEGVERRDLPSFIHPLLWRRVGNLAHRVWDSSNIRLLFLWVSFTHSPLHCTWCHCCTMGSRMWWQDTTHDTEDEDKNSDSLTHWLLLLYWTFPRCSLRVVCMIEPGSLNRIYRRFGDWTRNSRWRKKTRMKLRRGDFIVV